MNLKVTVRPQTGGCPQCFTDEQLRCIAERLCVTVPEGYKAAYHGVDPPGDLGALWQKIDACGNPVGHTRKWNGVSWV